MQVADLITPERVTCSLPAASKKRALEQLSGLMATGQTGLTQTEIFDSLISRERLGSTGLGHGVAIPHGRLKQSERTIGAFMKLRDPVDFDAADRQPVDLMFALLVPEQSTDEHLQLLAQLAQMFSDETLVRKLRETNDAEALYRLINNWRPAA